MYQSIFKPDLFAGKVALVTGGGSGLGRCTAHELAHLGATVALVGRKAEKLQQVKDELAQLGHDSSLHTCDIRDESAVAAMVAEVCEQHGGIDFLLNNAGGQFPARLEDMSANGFQAVVSTNLTGGFLVARECLKQSMREKGGSIVNIVADMWGSMPTMGHSGAARAGMVSFTETASLEWAHYGVRVNAVAPGYIASSGFDQYPPEVSEWIKGLAATVPAQRLGSESEISSAVCFLFSEAASFITGSVLRVDGGRPQVRDVRALKAHENSDVYDGFHLASQPDVLK